MLDLLLFLLPLVPAAIFTAILSYHHALAASTRLKVYQLATFGTFVIAFWLIIFGFIRPLIVAHQLGNLKRIEGELAVVQSDVAAGKLETALASLAAVKVNTAKWRASMWTLPRPTKRCEEIANQAEQLNSELAQRAITSTSEIARKLSKRAFDGAVSTFVASKLDPTDGFGSNLRELIWDMASDDVRQATARVGRLRLVADVKDLSRVVAMQPFEHQSRVRRIVEEIKPIVEQAKQVPSGRLQRIGRAIVWDFTKDQKWNAETAPQLVPEESLASFRDSIMTVYCITTRKWVEAATYYGGGHNSAAFHEDVDIAAVYWPSKKCAGVSRISAPSQLLPGVKYPPDIHGIQDSYLAFNIKLWIESVGEDERTVFPRLPIRSLEDLRLYQQIDMLDENKRKMVPEASKLSIEGLRAYFRQTAVADQN